MTAFDDGKTGSIRPGVGSPAAATSTATSPALLEDAGFRVVVDERMYIPGVKVLSYNYWGSAVGD